MCGIAGIISPRPIAHPDALAARLHAALRHRGPDAAGWRLLDDGRVLLASTRLAIVDPENGNQPLEAPDGRVIVVNGEIYNHVGPRARFGGFQYATRCDVEPLLPLHAAEGDAFAQHVNGMYAAALFDPATRSVVLARDRLGIKTLYYAADDHGTIGFASEPRALAAAGLLDFALEPDQARQLLQLQFTVGRSTPLAGVYRVLPGETLVIREGAISGMSDPSPLPAKPFRGSCEEGLFLSVLDVTLRAAVRTHGQGAGAMGLFLSGGIDSSILLAVAEQEWPKRFHAYVCGFDSGGTVDERRAARDFAGRLGVEVVEVAVGPDTLIRDLPAIAAAFDDPTMDYAVIPTFALARAARRDVKVVLSGEGGDEVFAGYGRHRQARRWWNPLRRTGWSSGILDGYEVLRDPRTDWRARHRAEQPAPASGAGALMRAQFRDFGGWLQNDLMLKLDRCTMANGVEARVPYLDETLLRFGLALPSRAKIRRGLGKWLMRRWLELHTPYAAPFARKCGFTVPIGPWLAPHAARLGPLVARQAGVRKLCQPAAVERLFRSLDGCDGRHTAKAAWTLLFFAAWHRVHIESRAPDGTVFDLLDGA